VYSDGPGVTPGARKPLGKGGKGKGEKGVFAGLRLGVAQWGVGKMIGAAEIIEGKANFECSYETAVHSECELFEIPRQALEDIMRAKNKMYGNNTTVNGGITGVNKVETGEWDGLLMTGQLTRVQRVADALQATFHQAKKDHQACEELQAVLPLLSGVATTHRRIGNGSNRSTNNNINYNNNNNSTADPPTQAEEGEYKGPAEDSGPISASQIGGTSTSSSSPATPSPVSAPPVVQPPQESKPSSSLVGGHRQHIAASTETASPSPNRQKQVQWSANAAVE
jgi:hypothetical protein